MDYTNISELIYERIKKGVKPFLTQEEAINYLGKENVQIIDNLVQYCTKMGYDIYSHETDYESAKDIMNRGFICYQEEITRDDFFVGACIKEKQKFKPTECDTEGTKIAVYDGNFQNESHKIISETDDTQHFFKGVPDYVSFVYAMVNRTGVGAKCIAIVKKELPLSEHEHTQYGVIASHYDEWDDKQIKQSYFARQVVDREFFIGFFDIINKKFVLNENFKFNHRVDDEISLSISEHELFSEWFRKELQRQTNNNESFDINER